MFLYKITTNADLASFVVNMASYAIQMRPRVIGGELIIDVRKHKLMPDDFRLAEMYMQMNHHQIGGVCPVCKGEGEAHCGHLTFGSAI